MKKHFTALVPLLLMYYRASVGELNNGAAVSTSSTAGTGTGIPSSALPFEANLKSQSR